MASLPSRIVYIRNKNNRSEWIAIITIDMTLTEEEIIALNSKRWDTESFYKNCKSYLKFEDEF